MEIATVMLARTIALIETGLLNPRGELPLERFTSLIRERFSFMGVPVKLEDFDSSKGVTFKAGYFEGQSIDELVIYSDGIKIDLRSSTENGQKIITESLEWLSKETKLAYKPGMIPRWAFLSQFVVRSDMNFDAVHSAFSSLSRKISHLVNERTNEHFVYRTNAITFDFPKLSAEYAIAPFTIERRIKTPDSEREYFSQAPMQTGQHFQLLQEFERDLSQPS